MARKKQSVEDVYIPEKQEAPQQCGASCVSGDTVVVCLCYPQGLIFQLNNGKPHRVELKGNAANLVGVPKGILPQGGFGLTIIPKDDWEEIQHFYGKMEIFKNGLCFAQTTMTDAKAEADEKAELRHGREPVIVEGADKQSKTDSVTADALA